MRPEASMFEEELAEEELAEVEVEVAELPKAVPTWAPRYIPADSRAARYFSLCIRRLPTAPCPLATLTTTSPRAIAARSPPLRLSRAAARNC
jgi:hypothetical protein